MPNQTCEEIHEVLSVCGAQTVDAIKSQTYHYPIVLKHEVYYGSLHNMSTEGACTQDPAVMVPRDKHLPTPSYLPILNCPRSTDGGARHFVQ